MLLMRTQEKIIGLYKKNLIKNLDYWITELNYSLGLDWIRFHKKLQNNTHIVNSKVQA